MIKYEEKIIFRPMNSSQLNICHKLNIPYLTSAVYGANFPIFIGDIMEKDRYFKIIEEAEEIHRKENE